MKEYIKRPKDGKPIKLVKAAHEIDEIPKSEQTLKHPKIYGKSADMMIIDVPARPENKAMHYSSTCFKCAKFEECKFKPQYCIKNREICCGGVEECGPTNKEDVLDVLPYTAMYNDNPEPKLTIDELPKHDNAKKTEIAIEVGGYDADNATKLKAEIELLKKEIKKSKEILYCLREELAESEAMTDSVLDKLFALRQEVFNLVDESELQQD